jgi:predicted enzyme related to lactoylglutathione lyase
MSHVINWFELPVMDMDRAMKFYGAILGSPFKAQQMGGGSMAVFPQDDGIVGEVGGALCQGEGYAPSREGALVYLNGGDDLSGVLNRVEGAGGKVVRSKMSIGEHGFIAIFEDTEGNRVALHSMQ